MLDFSQFDSLIAMTMYFNDEDRCKEKSLKHVGVRMNSKMLFVLIAVSTIALSERIASSVATTANVISLARWVLSLRIATFHL